MDPSIHAVGADLFSFQSHAAGPSQICALLHAWRMHRASMLRNVDVAASPEARSAIDFMESRSSDFRRALVTKVRKYLSDHLDEKVGLTQIASAIGVAPAYLAQTFRTAEGVSLYRYALRMRLLRSLELLPQYEDLSRLALDAGFSNHSHFTTAFRQSFGYAPALVRSQMRVRLGNAHSDTTPCGYARRTRMLAQ
jgi:AraC-like DNA-binding protein